MATESVQPGLGQRPPYQTGADGPDTHFQQRAAHRHYARRSKVPSLDTRTLAEGLGWFSVALGAAAIFAPKAIGAITGTGRRGVAQSIGVRELATGIGILTQRNPAPWLWSRVVGDVIDLAVLGTAMNRGGPGRGRATLSFAAVAGILAVDAVAAAHLTRHADHPLVSGVAAPTDLYFETSIATIKSPDECYQFWRNVENLPRFMNNLESVKQLDERRFHWVAKGVSPITSEWDCEITEDRPGAALAWRTVNAAEVPNAGSVLFEAAPRGRGTIVRLSVHYRPVGGRLTAALARLLRQDPQTQVQQDLRRFKQLIETGEIATTNGQPTGRRTLVGRAARRWRLTSSN
jgi:uncharacterized membrane protein